MVEAAAVLWKLLNGGMMSHIRDLPDFDRFFLGGGGSRISVEDDEEDDEAVASMEVKFTEADRRFMRRALELANTALGKTRPNPIVGCVIVDEGSGEIVGEGFHPKAGEPHAEVFALRAAGEKARGATAYVSLEPCNHHGKTPPCVDALLKAGVKKVVAGMVDPFPLVAGKGLERLRENGVEVLVGCEEEKCREANKAFIHRVLHKAVRGSIHLTYHEGAFSMPSKDNLLTSLGPSLYHQHDAYIAEGLEGMQWLGSDADLPDSAARVLMLPSSSPLSSLPLTSDLWTLAGKGVPVVVFAKGPLTSAEDESAAASLRGLGVEVVVPVGDGNADDMGPTSVQEDLYRRGMLSAFWLLGGESAKVAVSSGCIRDLSVHASLVEADELDDMAERFGRPMRVSVMSCDALQTNACILAVEVEP